MQTLCEKLTKLSHLVNSIKTQIGEITTDDATDLNHLIDLLNTIDNLLAGTSGTKVEDKVYNMITRQLFKNI